MQKPSPKPPTLPLRFLKWFCRPNYYLDIEGDLLELYEKRRISRGKYRANFYLLKDILLLIRPGIIKEIKIGHKFNYMGSLSHVTLISFRNIIRHKTSFLINMVGLATGLSCAILIMLWVNHELAIDRFHANSDRLYQVMRTYKTTEGTNTFDWTSGLLADALQEEIPEVENATKVYPVRDMATVSVKDEEKLRVHPIYTDGGFFDIFSFPIISGNTSSFAKNQTGIAISHTLALNLFGQVKGAIGTTVNYSHAAESGSYVVGAVFEVPEESTLQFDIVLPYTVYARANPDKHRWSYRDPSTFILAQAGVPAELINQKMTALLRKHVGPESGAFLSLYQDRYLNGLYEDGKQTGGRMIYIKLFSLVGIFVLLIAAINYINLSTAQSSLRLKEVGVKKVLGAARGVLLVQFLGESIITVMIALAVALGLVYLLLPVINTLMDSNLVLGFDHNLLYVAALTAFTGLISGSYPALVISGFNPLALLQGKANQQPGSLGLRQILVTFQFTLSIIFLVMVLVVYNQTNLIRSTNLGYDRENIVYFNKGNELAIGFEAFLNEFSNITGVEAVAGFDHNILDNYGTTIGVSWEGKSEEDQIPFSYITANYGYLDLLGVKLAEGRTYSKEFASENDQILFNEAAIETMGLQNPIGQTIRFWGRDRQIIGVVKDFHYATMYEQIKPCAFILREDSQNIMVKLSAGQPRPILEEMEAIYSKYSDGSPLELSFLDWEYERMYQSENQAAILSNFFTAITVVISCLGLFGLAAFTAARKVKEIGIRKFLGAKPIGIVKLLSVDFTKIIVLAIFLALPVSYILANTWLSSFAYRIHLQWWYFAGAGFSALLIAWFTIATLTYKAAKVSPAQCLREE